MKLILELREPASGWTTTDLCEALHDAGDSVKQRFGSGYRALNASDIGKGMECASGCGKLTIAGRWKIVEDSREII